MSGKNGNTPKNLSQIEDSLEIEGYVYKDGHYYSDDDIERWIDNLDSYSRSRPEDYGEDFDDQMNNIEYWTEYVGDH